MRPNSQGGARPVCSGRLATPVRAAALTCPALCATPEFAPNSEPPTPRAGASSWTRPRTRLRRSAGPLVSPLITRRWSERTRMVLACSAMKPTRRSGRANWLSWNASSTPFGPASTLATPARLHSCLIPTSCSSCSVSAGQRAEAVDQLGGERLDVVRRLQRREAAIHLQAQVEVLDVTLGNQGGGVDRDLRRPVLRLLGHALAALLAREHHGLLEQVVVQLEADLPDVARTAPRRADCRRRGCPGRARRAGSRRPARPGSG